jgi:hypothetical protein
VYAAVAAVLGTRDLLQLRAEAVNVKPSDSKVCDAADFSLGRSRVAAVIPNQGVLRYLVEVVSDEEGGWYRASLTGSYPKQRLQQHIRICSLNHEPE